MAACGAYDSDTNEPGAYYYTVTDMNGCMDSALVMLVDTVNLGLVQSVVYCGDSPQNLNGFFPDLELAGVWMEPGYPEVEIPLPDGVIDPAADEEGIYTYIFSEPDGCTYLMEVYVTFSVVFDPDLNLEPITVCSSELFNPAEAFGIEEWNANGDWLVYDGNEMFIGYFPELDIDFAWPYFEEHGPQLKFVWVVGTPPCQSFLYEKLVNMQPPITEMVNATVCASVINLSGYLPEGIPDGGEWSDSTNVDLGESYDCSACTVGYAHEFYYSYQTDEGCAVSVVVGITIDSPDAGSDYSFDFCASGDVVSLMSLLGDDAGEGGEFDIDPPFIIADSASAGEYVYSFPGSGCPENTAVYTINFIEQFSFTSEMICTGDGTTFTAIIEFIGGQPPYYIDGTEVEGSVYEEEGLLVSDDMTFVITSDSSPCISWQAYIGVPDNDFDGICDAMDITGCMDPEASNYNPLAINPGFCFYEMGSPDITYTDDVYEGLGLIGSGGSGGGTGNQDGLLVSVFPNPAVDMVSLDIRGLSPCYGLDNMGCEVVVEIRDILGVLRYSKVLATGGRRILERIDLDGFASGVYLVRVIDGGEEAVLRVVVGR